MVDDTNKISLGAAHAALDEIAMKASLGPTPPASLLAQTQPQPVVDNPLPPPAPPVTADAAASDLLSIVRVKLNRVANEFGIPYAHVRDFFVSHL